MKKKKKKKYTIYSLPFVHNRRNFVSRALVVILERRRAAFPEIESLKHNNVCNILLGQHD